MWSPSPAYYNRFTGIAVPVIAVFTKLDQLIDSEERNMDESLLDDLSEPEVYDLVKSVADTTLQKVCIGPFEELVGKVVPHVTVSSKQVLRPSSPSLSNALYQRKKDTSTRSLI